MMTLPHECQETEIESDGQGQVNPLIRRKGVGDLGQWSQTRDKCLLMVKDDISRDVHFFSKDFQGKVIILGKQQNDQSLSQGMSLFCFVYDCGL